MRVYVYEDDNNRCSMDDFEKEEINAYSVYINKTIVRNTYQYESPIVAYTFIYINANNFGWIDARNPFTNKNVSMQEL